MVSICRIDKDIRSMCTGSLFVFVKEYSSSSSGSFSFCSYVALANSDISPVLLRIILPGVSNSWPAGQMQRAGWYFMASTLTEKKLLAKLSGSGSLKGHTASYYAALPHPSAASISPQVN